MLRRSAVAALLLVPGRVFSQELTARERASIDSAATAILRATGAPAASIAIVRAGVIAYEKAYGNGRINPVVPANTSMRFGIGSVSKQFTATAVLLLAEAGTLSLDDKVAKWFPKLTRANDISIRQLLSMTSGYQDYWPQDYVFPDMQRPANADEIVTRWAAKPLDFEPGTKWQYSNTNYVIAASIVERVSGVPFFDFLKQRIFTKLKMTSVTDIDAGPLSVSDAGSYLRNAVGSLRAAPKEGKGWLFGAGQLAMTAHDLALWNIAVMDQTLLKAASYKTQQRTVLLDAGVSTGYGLGVNISAPDGRRRVSHGGAVSGYTTTNQIFPDERAAIVVYTNIYPGAAGAPGQIADRIAAVLFAKTDSAAAASRSLARRIYDGLLKGTIDRTLLTGAANAYFTPEVIRDYAESLGALGTPSEFTGGATQTLRGGLSIRSYSIKAGPMRLSLVVMTQADGTIDQYIVQREG
jgi:CubicO group peptidase (beta-lactamase class C family)